MKTLLAQILAFFGPVKTSIAGYLNPTELYRSIVAGLGASTLVGVLILVVTSVSAHASTIFPNPTLAALATFALAQMADQLRRVDHSGHDAGPVQPAEAGPFPLSLISEAAQQKLISLSTARRLAHESFGISLAQPPEPMNG